MSSITFRVYPWLGLPGIAEEYEFGTLDYGDRVAHVMILRQTAGFRVRLLQRTIDPIECGTVPTWGQAGERALSILRMLVHEELDRVRDRVAEKGTARE